MSGAKRHEDRRIVKSQYDRTNLFGETVARCKKCNYPLEVYEVDFTKNNKILRCQRCGLHYIYKKDFVGNWKLLKVVNPDLPVCEKSEPVLLLLDVETIKNLPSGSCIIPFNQTGDTVAVCKEKRMIKIFKIVEEKK